ncbi:MAG: hypothetical protein K2W99_07305 [Chthoniobacterales bacterium]|nr:hypothetical protein [Chthoniobacterales bacterium]
MNPDFSSNSSPESSFEEKTPKINLPPKPALVSNLPSKPYEASPLEEEIPPMIPFDGAEAVEDSKKSSSFSVSFPVVLIAFIAGLLAFLLQLWILF